MNLPATISSVQVPVLNHKNVVASEASNSRLVLPKGYFDFEQHRFSLSAIFVSLALIAFGNDTPLWNSNTAV